jgi:hypothetical protein
VIGALDGGTDGPVPESAESAIRAARAKNPGNLP